MPHVESVSQPDQDATTKRTNRAILRNESTNKAKHGLNKKKQIYLKPYVSFFNNLRIFFFKSELAGNQDIFEFQTAKKQRITNPVKMSREDVYSFVCTREGSQVAEKFHIEDIDGQALDYMSIGDLAKILTIPVGCAARIKREFESSGI